MIGFLANLQNPIEVSFVQWLSMGVFYTFAMSIVMAILLPILFKPGVDDLSDAVNAMKQDLAKHGDDKQQYIVAFVMVCVVFLWITDKSLVKSVLGFSLGLGGIAIAGAVTI